MKTQRYVQTVVTQRGAALVCLCLWRRNATEMGDKKWVAFFWKFRNHCNYPMYIQFYEKRPRKHIAITLNISNFAKNLQKQHLARAARSPPIWISLAEILVCEFPSCWNPSLQNSLLLKSQFPKIHIPSGWNCNLRKSPLLKSQFAKTSLSEIAVCENRAPGKLHA